MTHWHPRLFVVVLLLVLLRSDMPLEGQAWPLVAGPYQVTGVAPEGPYRGTAVIQQQDRLVFITWNLANGASFGYGLFVSDSLLAVGYAGGPNLATVVLYRLTPGGSLTGEWPVNGELFTETLTKRTQAAQRAPAPLREGPAL